MPKHRHVPRSTTELLNLAHQRILESQQALRDFKWRLQQVDEAYQSRVWRTSAARGSTGANFSDLERISRIPLGNLPEDYLG